MDRILVVTNAAAGTNEQEALDGALSVLRRAADVEVAATSTPDELDDVLAGLDGRLVVAAGGDGTLHALVNALARQELLATTRVGVVPLGTGNDFARGVGIPLRPDLAAETILSGRSVESDIVVDDEGTVIVNNAHLGVGAQASRKADRWKPRFGSVGLGRLGYVAGALSASLRPRLLEVDVVVDGVRLEGRDLTGGRSVAQVAIGNGSRVGGGTELIPGADPADGRLTVIVSRNRSLWSRLSYVARLRGGSHHLMKEVTQVTGTEVVVRGDSFYCVSDGEVSGPHTEKSWHLLRGAVTVIRP